MSILPLSPIDIDDVGHRASDRQFVGDAAYINLEVHHDATATRLL